MKNEYKYNILVEAGVSVMARNKPEAIQKATEILKGLEVQSFKIDSPKRTLQQNRSIHLYCTLLAQAFNEAGLDMKVVLKPDVDIEWSTENVKKYIWKPIQKALLGIESTTQLKRGEKEIDRVYDHINRHLSERFVGWIPPILFPSLENQVKESKTEYPNDYDSSKISF